MPPGTQYPPSPHISPFQQWKHQLRQSVTVPKFVLVPVFISATCSGTYFRYQIFRYQFWYFFRNQNFPVMVPTLPKKVENSRENSDTGNKYPGILLWNSIFLHPYFWPHLKIDLFVKANPKDLPLTGNWMLQSDILDTWWRGGRHGETLNFYTSARLSFVNKW